MKVKICGITETKDALRAVELGADALGFIFASSPRQISMDKARNIINAIPPFVKTVGVFVDEKAGKIREHINYCGLDLVQLHGNESPEFCRGLMPHTIKAFRIKDDSNPPNVRDYRSSVRAFLLDTYVKDKAGGTGQTFDWRLAVRIKDCGIPLILSGGLGPANIAEAIRRVRPYAVDVNSGVEECPGKKSYSLMKELMTKVSRID
ncbi:Phosphoribosylanthranilate isomerase (EC [Olavius algarvensis Delta 1 endosymbiont]|nr:Phosphoribosylanthranilate isomerase (EC [Olavius algarvensis Delta 1 endosymbiont]